MNEQIGGEYDFSIGDLAGLCQIGKIGAIGAMAAGIAHDFNNLLSPIVMLMAEVQRDVAARSPEQSRRIDRALSCAERAQGLVQRILAFTRAAPPDRRLVDTAELVVGMSDIFASALPSGIIVEFDVGPRLPAIEADRNQLEMALLNLVINARDAMPDGGKITIAAAAEVFVPADVRQNEPARMLRISVSDSGVGMDDATLRRAIEPFFSTKVPGRGSGLGLPIVRAIVKQSGGHLSIQSKPGCGTTVDMWLPVAEEGGGIGVAA